MVLRDGDDKWQGKSEMGNKEKMRREMTTVKGDGKLRR